MTIELSPIILDVKKSKFEKDTVKKVQTLLSDYNAAIKKPDTVISFRNSNREQRKEEIRVQIGSNKIGQGTYGIVYENTIVAKINRKENLPIYELTQIKLEKSKESRPIIKKTKLTLSNDGARIVSIKERFNKKIDENNNININETVTKNVKRLSRKSRKKSKDSNTE